MQMLEESYQIADSLLHEKQPLTPSGDRKTGGEELNGTGFTGILGLLTMLALAYAFSTNRRAIRVKTVAWGLGLQLAFRCSCVESGYRAAGFS